MNYSINSFTEASEAPAYGGYVLVICKKIMCVQTGITTAVMRRTTVRETGVSQHDGMMAC